MTRTSAEQEALRNGPVAYLWQHTITGQTKALMRDDVFTAGPHWRLVGPLRLATESGPDVHIAARIRAQEEVVALKERITRAGVEQRRAVLEEREACAKACEGMARLTAAVMGMEIQDACAAAIRARK